MSDHSLPIADRAAVRRALWRLIRGDGRAMVGVLLLAGLAAAAGLGAPWLLGEIVNAVEAGTAASTIDVLTLAVVGFALAQLVLTRYARYAAHRFGERALARLREEFVDRVLALPTGVVERAGTGDLTTRSSGDVSTVGTTVRDAAPEVLIAVVRVVLVLGAVFVLNPLLGLCGLVGLPLLAGVARWYLRRARAAYLAEGAANSGVSESLAATAEGGRTVEAFGLGARRVGLGDAWIATAFAARERTLWLRTVLFPVADVAHVLPTVLGLLVGGLLYDAGLASLGAVVAASLYFWQLVEPMDVILERMEQLQRSGASFARLVGVESGVGAGPRGAYAVPVDDRIDVSAAHFAYDGGPDVLVDVDLRVRPGERLAVVGPSGAGKSTLGRLLAGVDAPRLGAVTVGGVPVADLAPEEMRRRVLLVTQEHHVFLGTLRDNLSIAAPTADDAAFRSALDTVDAHWVDELPAGLDTVLGPDGIVLDAARAQQLALARVVLADPHTVVLDEATAALDPTAARHTERSLARALAGRTVIAVAHRLHTAHHADRVAVLDGGRVVELGTHDELVRAEGSYAALWRSWHGGGPGDP